MECETKRELNRASSGSFVLSDYYLRRRNKSVGTSITCSTDATAEVNGQHDWPSSETSMSPSRSTTPRAEHKHPFYKTELCRSWDESGKCRYGSQCQFAHGEAEIIPLKRHPKYKTIQCRSFDTSGVCYYGARCRFLHKNEQTTKKFKRCSRRLPIFETLSSGRNVDFPNN